MAVMSGDSEVTPWSLPAGRLGSRAVFGVGAAALVASFYIGTADITIATRMGALFGFDLWWTYFVLGLAGWSLMDMSVRYYLRFGRTPLALFKELHPLLAIYLFVTVVVTTILGAYSQWNACAHVLGGLVPALSPEVGGAIACGAALLFLSWGVYQRLEVLFAFALLALVSLFAFAAIASDAPWRDAPAGLIPSAPPEEGREEWLGLIQSNAGSLINAWLILIYPYTMLEKGWFSTRLPEKLLILKRARLDYALGIAAAGVVALPLMAAAAAVARPFGIVPSNYTEFAALLEPVAGNAATLFFLIGLFLAAWTAGIGWLVCGAYAMLDLGNLPLRMGTRPFRSNLILFGVASVAILVLRVNPFYGIRIFSAFLSVVFPVVAIALAWRVSRPDMGYFRWWPRNARGLVLMALDVFAVVVSIIVGWGISAAEFELLWKLFTT